MSDLQFVTDTPQTITVFDQDEVAVWEGTTEEFGEYLERIRGGELIDRDVVTSFLSSRAEIGAGPDDWPELAALYKALGYADD